MTKELEQLRRNMSALTNQDLLRIATVDASKYRPEAIQIAREELQRRDVVDISIEACQAAQATIPTVRLEVLPSTVVEPLAGYAGFWKRSWAFVIDVVVINAGLFVAACVLMDITVQRTAPYIEIAFVAFWLYWAGLESSGMQATLGKLAVGVKVTDLQGNRLSFGRASMRWVGILVSSSTLTIGFLMAGFTKRKQALHDILAGCLVVNR